MVISSDSQERVTYQYFAAVKVHYAQRLHAVLLRIERKRGLPSVPKQRLHARCTAASSGTAYRWMCRIEGLWVIERHRSRCPCWRICWDLASRWLGGRRTPGSRTRMVESVCKHPGAATPRVSRVAMRRWHSAFMVASI